MRTLQEKGIWFVGTAGEATHDIYQAKLTGPLATMTSGRGQFSMEFSHYAACPQNVADTVIAAEKEKNAAK